MVPLVGKLKKFYEFSQRLGIHPPGPHLHPAVRLRCYVILYLKMPVSRNAGGRGGGRQMSLFIKGHFKAASHTHDLHI